MVRVHRSRDRRRRRWRASRSAGLRPSQPRGRSGATRFAASSESVREARQAAAPAPVEGPDRADDGDCRLRRLRLAARQGLISTLTARPSRGRGPAPPPGSAPAPRRRRDRSPHRHRCALQRRKGHSRRTAPGAPPRCGATVWSCISTADAVAAQLHVELDHPAAELGRLAETGERVLRAHPTPTPPRPAPFPGVFILRSGAAVADDRGKAGGRGGMGVSPRPVRRPRGIRQPPRDGQARSDVCRQGRAGIWRGADHRLYERP